MDIVATIISGVISGLIASLIISLVLIRIKPKILISSQLCRHVGDGAYSVKIVNLSRSHLLDVKYVMRICTQRADGIIEIDEIPSLKEPLESISKYDEKDLDASYALRFSYDLEEHFPRLEEDGCYFEFTIRARHSMSNAVAFAKQRYKKNDRLEGQFETGVSTRIVQM